MLPYSTGQLQALAILPKISSSLSLMGSLYIIWDVRCRHKRSRCRTYHRLLLGLSICDLFYSSGFILSTWAIPRGTLGSWGAVGNTLTCSLQGGMIQFGLSAILYNTALGFYYMFSIRNGWSANQIFRVEPYMHALPLIWGLGTTIASFAMQLFNSRGWVCHISPLPRNCIQSWQSGGPTNCIRGDNASLFFLIFSLIPTWICIAIVTICMLLVYRSVRLNERACQRYEFSRRLPSSGAAVSRSSTTSSVRSSITQQVTINGGNRVKKYKMSKRIAQQNYLYVGALYITYISVPIVRMSEKIVGRPFYWMLVMSTLTTPGQGFWNVLVYLRPRFVSIRRKQKRTKKLRNERVQPAESRRKSAVVDAVAEAVHKGGLSTLDSGIEGGPSADANFMRKYSSMGSESLNISNLFIEEEDIACPRGEIALRNAKTNVVDEETPHGFWYHGD